MLAAHPCHRRSWRPLVLSLGCLAGAAIFWQVSFSGRVLPRMVAGDTPPAVHPMIPAPRRSTSLPQRLQAVEAKPRRVFGTALAPEAREQSGGEIVFAVNSSFLSPDAEAQLERLLRVLEPARRYQVELAAAVGGQNVRGVDTLEARNHNRWLVERRLDRVAALLRRKSPTPIEIGRHLVGRASTRRVAITVRSWP